MIDVLLADDQELVRTGFRMILESEPGIKVVGEATTGREALTLSARLRPAVVLMDIRMPELDGLQATHQLTARNPAPRVVILTTFDLDEYVFEALHSGASGFLLKTAPADQLLAAVRIAAAGDALLSPPITRRLIEHYAQQTRTPAPDQQRRLDQLTARELDVLKLVARGLSNQEIARALVLATTTVKSHVASLLAKLGARDRTQLVILAYETGLIQPGAQ
jgi:DNA-binding NarL/FixJ family response regulator